MSLLLPFNCTCRLFKKHRGRYHYPGREIAGLRMQRPYCVEMYIHLDKPLDQGCINRSTRCVIADCG